MTAKVDELKVWDCGTNGETNICLSCKVIVSAFGLVVYKEIY